jgi:hypothetical protein
VIPTIKIAANPGCPRRTFGASPLIGKAKKRIAPNARTPQNVILASLLTRICPTNAGRLLSPKPAKNSHARKGRRKNAVLGETCRTSPQHRREVSKKTGTNIFLRLNIKANTGTRR